MPLTSKQFSYLTEMGISLWQQKKLNANSFTENKSADNSLEQVKQRIENSTAELPQTIAKQLVVKAIKINDIYNSRLFNDILIALETNLDNIAITTDCIKFKSFSWYFNESSNIELLDTEFLDINLKQTELKQTKLKHSQFSKKQLITPELPFIANSPQLKKQLWLLLQAIN